MVKTKLSSNIRVNYIPDRGKTKEVLTTAQGSLFVVSFFVSPRECVVLSVVSSFRVSPRGFILRGRL